MHTSLITLQYAELITILPQIDNLAETSNLSRADIIRNILYQYFEYQAPEMPSKQKEQEHNKEVSLQLTLQNRYVPVFLDISFQSKYLGTNSFSRMITAVNILNNFFNCGILLKTSPRKQLKYTFNPQIIANFEGIFNETLHKSQHPINKQDLNLLSNLSLYKTIIGKNGIIIKRNGVIKIKNESIRTGESA